MAKMLDIIDAVSECEKHQCSTIAVSQAARNHAICEGCPSFDGIYVESMDYTFATMERARVTGGIKQVKCIYPEENS